MNMASAASTEQFNDPFWKSQSMDTINQLLNGCQALNIPLTPIASDVKADSSIHQPSPNTASITQSLSFSAFLPSLQISNSGTVTSSQTFPSAQGQALEANVSSPVQIQNAHVLSTSSGVSSMIASFHPNQIVSATNATHSKELVRVEKEPTYVDVTPFLILPQHEAARRLGIPCSTLSKRWKEASVNRKWPYRIVCKLDKEITTLLKNVENSANNLSSPLSPAVEENLGLLLKKRQEELRTVVIRIN